MPLISWQEVRERAYAFVHEWQGETSESREAQSFWNEFFEVFGIRRRAVAAFEDPVRNIRGRYGFIDLFWKSVLLVEHKSAGESLDAAESQASDYIQDLAREGRQDEIPRFVIVSDFQTIALHDLEPAPGENLPLFAGKPFSTVTFPLSELPRHIRQFAFLRREKTFRIDPEDPANQKAYELMCRLHDEVERGGFSTPDLERLLVRILFCLFAEDTGIFDQPTAFQTFLRENTREDGSDLGARLNELFDVLNTPVERRSTALHESLASLPYVNGNLFAERLGFATFTRPMREALLAAAEFHWARISPAVFGSLFQGVMEPVERRQAGAHYTSERDILKLLRSLFLDEFQAQLETIKADRSTRREARLEEFCAKLRVMRLLDPACGCGNFLVLAYRELRQLETDAISAMATAAQQVTNIRDLIKVDVDQLFGIEIDAWPVRIAEVALWLMDHQMNQLASERFGQSFQRLPLVRTPHIVCANALRVDWNTVLPAEQCSYVLGNPPFIGHHYQTDDQKADQDEVLGNIRGNGVLDYVTNWYVKAAEYIQGHAIPVAFVSTNSITQGEQVGILWSELFSRYRLKLHFGHRTFPWVSEARGRAHVHVVINGFGNFDVAGKRIYDYERQDGNVVILPATNVCPYLIEGPDLVVRNRTRPLSPNVPRMLWGNKPTDGGNLILSEEERADLLAREPDAEPLIRQYMGGKDFLDNVTRYCLWLPNADPGLLRRLPSVMARVEAVRSFRLESKAPTTVAFATKPTIFRQIAQPASEYLAVPEASSESRRYIPMAYVPPEIICSNTVQFVPNASHWHFGVLTSSMHMAWVKIVCGRLKSDYRYSNTLVYNNFPWPEDVDERRRATVEECARVVLAVRAAYLPPTGSACLSDIYDPLAMPPDLSQAHAELDRAVERCYRSSTFDSDRERFEYLFAVYQHFTSPLLPATSARRSRRSVAT